MEHETAQQKHASPADDKHRFADSVYAVVRQIPRGCVTTYGQIARMIGHPRSARYVGYVLHNNPSPGQGTGATPCHRVVFKDGSTTTGFAFGGPEVQRALLKDEGVPFLDETHVDLSACLWPSHEENQHE
ncbi:MAG: MGMT family protein [Atopobiaceae bacterium]|jgi:methylated-DNA-protein-cysteine methyltransferase-like protein